MGWIWRNIGWLARMKFRFWYFAILLGGLFIGIQSIWQVLTLDRVDATITRVVATCEVKCSKISQTVRHNKRKRSCAAVRAYIAANGLVSCRSEPTRRYEVSYLTRTGNRARMQLSTSSFEGRHSRGDVVSLLRDADPKSPDAFAPPRGFEFGALGVGLVLLAWTFRRRILRLLRRRSPKRTRRKFRPQRLRRARYEINGPIKTYRR